MNIVNKSCYLSLILFIILCHLIKLYGGGNSDQGLIKKILVLPFINNCSYKGKWDISDGVRKLLAEKFDKKVKWEPVLPSRKQLERSRQQINRTTPHLSRTERLAKLAELYNCVLVIDGTINRFDIRNFGVVHPTYGGYSSYMVDTAIEIFVVNISTPENVLQEEIKSVKSNEQDIGTIFIDGHNWSKELKSIEEFDKLKTMDFGSQRWQETQVGLTVDRLLDTILTKTTNYSAVYLIDSETKKPGEQ